MKMMGGLPRGAARSAAPTGARAVVAGGFAAPAVLLGIVHRALPTYRLFALHAQRGRPDRDSVTPFVRSSPRLEYVPARLSLAPMLFDVPGLVLLHTTAPRNGLVSPGIELNVLPFMPGLHLSALPGNLLRLAERHGSSAVANASAAAGALHAAVRDRAELTRSLLHETADTAPDAGELSVLSDVSCWELLGSRSVGRLAYTARRGVPDIAPVNYVLLDGDVLIQSGPGPKLQAAERQELVAFEVDDLDETDRSGWSVIVYGRASRLPWTEQQQLHLRETPWAGGPRRQLIRIAPRRITGRRISGRSTPHV